MEDHTESPRMVDISVSMLTISHRRTFRVVPRVTMRGDSESLVTPSCNMRGQRRAETKTERPLSPSQTAKIEQQEGATQEEIKAVNTRNIKIAKTNKQTLYPNEYRQELERKASGSCIVAEMSSLFDNYLSILEKYKLANGKILPPSVWKGFFFHLYIIISIFSFHGFTSLSKKLSRFSILCLFCHGCHHKQHKVCKRQRRRYEALEGNKEATCQHSCHFPNYSTTNYKLHIEINQNIERRKLWK